MPEVNITTVISPATANKLRMNLYLASAPLAAIDTIEQDWDNENHWIFTDLQPATNYIYNLFEVDSAGLTLQQYTKSPNFVTRSAGSISVKPPQDLTVNATPGLLSGTTSATFADWVGWEPIIEDVGAGTMEKNVSYSYDIAAGKWDLLGQDHKFLPFQRFFVNFQPKVTASSNTVSRDIWSGILLVTSNQTLTASDFGKKVLIKGSSTYLNLTLPDLTTVAEGKPLFIESARGNHINATIISSNGNAIDWLEGGRTKIYIGQDENLTIYRFGNTWRVHAYEGNFKTVGQSFTSYADNHLNAVELNGQQLNALEFSRLYNDYVLKLTNAVNYDDWITGNNGFNQYKFSRANASNLFRVPDLRGVMQVNAGANGYLYGSPSITIIQPGDFQEQSIIDIRHHLLVDDNDIHNGKPSGSDFLNWSSLRRNSNQDYDMVPPAIPDKEPTLAITGGPVDKFGNHITTGDKILPDRYAARRFILT